MFVRVKKTGSFKYLQVVENRRVGDKVRQKLVATLGRLDILRATGHLESILVSLAKYAEHAAVVEAHNRGELEEVGKRKIGPPLLFGRIWERLGIDGVLKSLLEDRKFEFPVAKAIFLTAVHRLMISGADRAAEKWKDGYDFDKEVLELDLHHLYRAMAWLGEPLPDDEQNGGTGFSPLCVKDRIEEALFQRNRDFFTGLDMVFFDTTSIYFEGEGGETIGQFGNSKDSRPDLKQMIVGVVLDSDGNPVCSEMWPGNTTDVKTLIPIVNRMRDRFGISRFCIVADRGMISSDTVKTLEDSGNSIEYILGARMRKTKEVKDDVLSRGGRYEIITPERIRRKDPSPLKVKEVIVEDRRYIVCHNEEQARKDKADREAILKSLADALKKGDKSLVGNKGYRKYVKSAGDVFEIDETKAIDEEKYDGKWVLRTNTDLPASEVALKYKQLLMVEQVFRTMKSILETRPIYHKVDETIRGHVFCSFLALVLKKNLYDAIDNKGFTVEWDDLKRDLDDVEEVELNSNGKKFMLRTHANGAVGKVFQAVGVGLPPLARQIDG